MKRSEINGIMREAIGFLDGHHFRLPPFAFWSLDEWRAKGDEIEEIVANRLGWDITDFGKGDFGRYGLFLFTLRNGAVSNLETGRGKLYAEKIMIVGEEQVTPLHFHWQKTEDIINRGGGRLLIRLYNSSPDGSQLLDTEVTVSTDGVRRTVAAGGVVGLNPGQSVTLETGVYHSFWGAAGEGTVLVGEVSVVNEDLTDNRFHEQLGRFPTIEEDEPPLYLLVGDYDRFLKRGG